MDNTYYTTLVSQDEIRLDSFSTGQLESTNYGAGQSLFTPDELKYIRFEAFDYTPTGVRIAIYDFDRCHGQLSYELSWDIPCNSLGGIAISPNSRFLYAPDVFSLWQYDLWAENIISSRTTVATWDGVAEPNWFATYFGLMALAPDGRIQIAPPCGGSRFIHVIKRPNLRGNSCHVL